MQTQLPLSREDRLALVDAVDPQRAGIAPRKWRSVRDLLKQIEFCTTASRRTVYLDVLAARMAVSRDTVMRAAKAAQAAGLLVTVATRQGSRQGASEFEIVWDRLRAVSGDDRPCAPKGTGRGTGVGAVPRFARLAPPELHEAPSESHDAPSGLHDASFQGCTMPQSSSSSLGKDVDGRLSTVRVARSNPEERPGAKPEVFVAGDDDGDQKDSGSGEDWETIRGRAEEIERRVGRCKSDRDWELAVKAAILVGRLSEAWLWDAVAGVERVRPKRKWGYLFACLDEGASKRHGAVFRRELKLCVVPAECVAYDHARWAEIDAAQRRRRRGGLEAQLDQDARSQPREYSR